MVAIFPKGEYGSFNGTIAKNAGDSTKWIEIQMRNVRLNPWGCGRAPVSKAAPDGLVVQIVDDIISEMVPKNGGYSFSWSARYFPRQDKLVFIGVRII